MYFKVTVCNFKSIYLKIIDVGKSNFVIKRIQPPQYSVYVNLLQTNLKKKEQFNNLDFLPPFLSSINNNHNKKSGHICKFELNVRTVALLEVHQHFISVFHLNASLDFKQYKEI